MTAMRKIFAICVAVLSVAATFACVKKHAKASDVSVQQNELTIIVMDTTQALLPEAEVKVGKATFKTSFDGRIVLKPEQWTGIKSLSVTCKGYKEAKDVALSASPMIVKLTRDKTKPTKDVYSSGLGVTRRSGTKGDLMYKTAMVSSAPVEVETLGVVEDGMAYEEEADVAFAVAESSKVMGYGSIATHVNNNISAGKLTAGEVNDYTKWSFWSKVLDGTHKQFIPDWRLEARERYTVQVMTKDGYPVVNYPVNLTDINGNTVFQAITDNTGKAELWNGLVQQLVEIREPEKVIMIDEPCEAPEAVDVMFVFDATGSMGDELRYLQAEMKDVISRAKDATGGLDIRTGAVVYRDHGDEYITRISRLTEDIKTTQTFIDKQSANGGGDFPEAIPEALMAALNSAGWNEYARARIAFLILDAPCHQDSATIALLHEQILNAAALGVRVVPVVCSGLDKSGELLMRSIALATNGTSFFLTDDSGIGHSHLKPTTDSLKVEHLNDMLVRTIVEFSAMSSCEPEQAIEVAIEEQFIPNPFDANKIEEDPTIPHGDGVHYLLDVSGKLITIVEGTFDESSLKGLQIHP